MSADFFAPRHCVVCGRENPKGAFRYLCVSCAKDLYFINGGTCSKCGEIIGRNSSAFVDGCAYCASEKPFFEHAASACVYGDPASEKLLFALKYNGGKYAADDIARLIVKNPRATEFLKGAIICPVPLHSKRMRKRKYNQSIEIVSRLEKIAPALGVKIEPLLKRVKNTKTQTALDRQERARNMRGAFAPSAELTKIPRPLREFARVVIFDDVMTTNATVSECARVLKREGFKNVDAFSVFKRI